MQKIHIPQEENKILEGQRKVMYVTGDDGHFERQKYGSSTEEFATQTAVEEFEQLCRESVENIQKKISSPIEYFMYKNRMDLPTLCSMVDMFSFRVKRHLKMKYFVKLNDKILSKYADVFGITLKELKDFTL